MTIRNIYIIFLLLFAFSKLNANNAFQSFKSGNDSLNVTDTVFISTEYYDETTIYLIDSICKKYDEILQKMPIPILILKQEAQMSYLDNKAYAVVFDSINKQFSINHYKEKLDTDTLDDVIREVYFAESSNNYYYVRVKYSNYKTGKLLMLVQSEPYTINTNITYFANNKIIKNESHTMLKYKPEDAKYHSHIYSYYKNQNLIGANIISSSKIVGIQISGDYHYISFDQSDTLSLMTRIDKNRFSKKSITKADKFWIKQK